MYYFCNKCKSLVKFNGKSTLPEYRRNEQYLIKGKYFSTCKCRYPLDRLNFIFIFKKEPNHEWLKLLYE